MSQFSPTAKIIQSIHSDELKLDLQIKKVLACKPILAPILQGVVKECQNMTNEQVEACIEGDIIVDSIYVESGFTEFIQGSSEEDYQVGEGMIRYDVRTYLLLPGANQKELIKILIDVEAQKDENPGYDLPLRALFYCSRMISAQLDKEFSTNTHDPIKYGNIKKVYSIWICTETAQKRANTIEQYSIAKEMLLGTDVDSPRYDILSAIIINISKTHNCSGVDNKLICMLTDLFNEDINADEKITLLNTKYGISMTQEVKKEVEAMCTYTANIKAESEARGEAKLGKLIALLQQKGLQADITKAATDENARHEMYKKYGIID